MPNVTLTSILNDPKAGERKLREKRIRAVSKGRTLQMENLWKAWDQRWPDATQVCPELGRRPTGDEHFQIWAGRLKRWGDSVRACGCRARNAL